MNVADGPNAPVQDRSRAALERILTASEELLTTQPQQFTMQRVATDAGVSVGSVYRYFANKRALLRASQDRVLTRLETDVAARIAAADPRIESIVAALVHSMRDWMLSSALAVRTFMIDNHSDEVMVGRAVAAYRTVFLVLVAGLARDRDRVAHDDLDAAGALVGQIAFSPFLNYSVAGRYSADRRDALERVCPEIIRACTVYLTTPFSGSG